MVNIMCNLNRRTEYQIRQRLQTSSPLLSTTATQLNCTWQALDGELFPLRETSVSSVSDFLASPVILVCFFPSPGLFRSFSHQTCRLLLFTGSESVDGWRAAEMIAATYYIRSLGGRIERVGPIRPRVRRHGSQSLSGAKLIKQPSPGILFRVCEWKRARAERQAWGSHTRRFLPWNASSPSKAQGPGGKLQLPVRSRSLILGSFPLQRLGSRLGALRPALRHVLLYNTFPPLSLS